MSYTRKETGIVCTVYVHVYVLVHVSPALSYLEDYFNA